jgi:drug/metabolite transporter (DMT)-like permease
MDWTVGYRSKFSLPLRGLSSRSLAIAGLAAAAILWGSSYVAAKSIIDTVPVFTLAFLRLAIAIAVITPLTRKTGTKPRFTRESLLLGLTGVAGMNALHNLGIERTTASQACLIVIGGSTVLTALLASLVRQEQIRKLTGTAIIASTFGVCMVASPTGEIGSNLAGAGNLLLLGAATCVAVYGVIGRRAFQSDFMAINAGSLVVGAVALLPFAIGENALSIVTALSGRDLVVLILLGAGVTGCTSILWAFSLRHLTATETAVMCSVEPVVGVLLASMTLGERFSGMQMLGALLIVISCLLAVAAPSRRTGNWRISIPRLRNLTQALE